MLAIRTARGAILAALHAGCWSCAGSAAGGSTTVQAVTDRLEPVRGGSVLLEQGRSSTVLRTDEQGQTRYVPLDASAGFRLTLADTVLPQGIALGTIEDVVGPSLGQDETELRLWEVSRTQPLAVPIALRGDPSTTSNYFPPEGDWPHWTVAVPQGSELDFPLHVASLLDAEAVASHMRYRGHPVASVKGYMRGVALVMPAVQLGEEGILVGFHLLGDLERGEVEVDLYELYQPPGSMPAGPALAVDVVDHRNDIVYVRIGGAVRAGQLALLARPPSFGSSRVIALPDAPPRLPSPAAGDEGRALSAGEPSPRAEGTAAVGLPEPPAPERVSPREPPLCNLVDWQCTPPPGPSMRHSDPSATGEVERKILRTSTDTWSVAPGTRVALRSGSTCCYKLMFELGGELLIGSGKIAAGNGFVYGLRSRNVHGMVWTAKEGESGLGESARQDHYFLACARRWTQSVDEARLSRNTALRFVAGARSRSVSSLCTDGLFSVVDCSR